LDNNGGNNKVIRIIIGKRRKMFARWRRTKTMNEMNKDDRLSGQKNFSEGIVLTTRNYSKVPP